MTKIELLVQGAEAKAVVHGPLTGGMVGVQVDIRYDSAWEGMVKTLVCRSSVENLHNDEVRTIVNVGSTAEVAHEVMIPGRTLYLGIEGCNGDGTKIIPTIWANCGKIQPGAKTDGESISEAVTPPVWQQMLGQMGSLEELDTDAKTSLVAAINEAMTKGTGLPGKDGRGIRSVVSSLDGSWIFIYEDGKMEQVSNEAYMAMAARMDEMFRTIADKQQLVPEFANTVSECTDTSKVYVLPDGYLWAYVATEKPLFKNQIPMSINADKTQYVGEKGEDGYKLGYRLNSSGGETALAGAGVTGFIPAKYGDRIYFKNFPYVPNQSATGNLISLYDSNFGLIGGIPSTYFDDGDYHVRPYTVDAETGYLTSITLANVHGDQGYAYIRISAVGLDGSTIVAVNEEIENTDNKVVVTVYPNQCLTGRDITDYGNKEMNGAGLTAPPISVSNGDQISMVNFPYIPGEQVEGNCIGFIFGHSAMVIPSADFYQYADLFVPYSIDPVTGYLTSITLGNVDGDTYRYMQLSAVGLDSSLDIAIYADGKSLEPAVTYAWENTGHAFVPADYEDRVIAMEGDVSLLKKAVQGDLAVYGIVDDENNIFMSGTLASGKYTLKYMAEDGTTTDIGEFTME